jgi:hypothetical protein
LRGPGLGPLIGWWRPCHAATLFLNFGEVLVHPILHAQPEDDHSERGDEPRVSTPSQQGASPYRRTVQHGGAGQRPPPEPESLASGEDSPRGEKHEGSDQDEEGAVDPIELFTQGERMDEFKEPRHQEFQRDDADNKRRYKLRGYLSPRGRSRLDEFLDDRCVSIHDGLPIE